MFCFRKPVRPLLYYDNFSVCTLLLSNVMTGHVPWANEIVYTHELVLYGAEHIIEFLLVT
jgi:hypothetical protein